MCIIVDANRLGNFLTDPADADALPIHRWIERGGRLVYSTDGRFRKEISERAKRKLLDYVRDGKAVFFPGASFKDDEDRLATQSDLRSNDPHILALAKASQARVLYTKDNHLMADFKNPVFINRPRGKVYSSAKNADLLRRTTCTG